jgi:small conductance mechanosensitive channel
MNWDKLLARGYNWVLNFGPRIVVALILLFLGLYLLRFAKKWLNSHFHKRQFDPSLRPFLISLFITTMQVLLVLGIMQILGVQMTIFAAIIGGLGVAAGLALSGTLQNFTSGILILFMKPFEVGDDIVAQGLEGMVTSIQIFYTVMLTYDNRTVIIPNSKLSNEVIINLSKEGKRRADIEFKLNFGISFDRVQSIIENTIQSNKDILKDPTHRIGVSSVESDGYRVMINVWVSAHGFVDAKMQLQQHVIADLKGAGIKLPGVA